MNRVRFVGTMRNEKIDIQQVFLALVRGGLWEHDVELRKYGITDFDEIMRLAEEQSVVGLGLLDWSTS